MSEGNNFYNKFDSAKMEVTVKDTQHYAFTNLLLVMDVYKRSSGIAASRGSVAWASEYQEAGIFIQSDNVGLLGDSVQRQAEATLGG